MSDSPPLLAPFGDFAHRALTSTDAAQVLGQAQKDFATALTGAGYRVKGVWTTSNTVRHSGIFLFWTRLDATDPLGGPSLCAVLRFGCSFENGIYKLEMMAQLLEDEGYMAARSLFKLCWLEASHSQDEAEAEVSRALAQAGKHGGLVALGHLQGLVEKLTLALAP